MSYDLNSIRGRGSRLAVADGATITLDSSLARFFQVTLGGNRTLAISNPPPSNIEQIIVLEVLQDGAGNRTLAQGANVAVSTALPWPSLSTAGGDMDVLTFKYSQNFGTWLLVAFISGF